MYYYNKIHINNLCTTIRLVSYMYNELYISVLPILLFK